MDDKSLYFVFDHYMFGTLSNLIQKQGRLEEQLCKLYAAELVMGIKLLHEKHIMHRDIKAENIMLDENLHLRIVDFGDAKQFNPSSAYNF